jgi:hypothetical protein
MRNRAGATARRIESARNGAQPVPRPMRGRSEVVVSIEIGRDDRRILLDA